MTYLTEKQVVDLLRAKKGSQTQAEIASRMGISMQYLGHILRGIRSPGQKVLKYLGLKKVTLYQRNGQ